MQEDQLRQLLEAIRNGSTDVNEAIQRLRSLPFEDVEQFARLDNHRALRCGFPEVVFGQGKTSEQVVKIVRRLAEMNDRVLVTRVSTEMYAAVQPDLPEMTYHAVPRLLVLDHSDPAQRVPGVVVATGGTADIPVAEEAAITAELMGSQVERIFDVGVAGIHRLLNQVERIQKANVIVVVAGMEGALASVVGGLVASPVSGGADQRGLRGQLWRGGGAAGDAQQLRDRRLSGEYRQRFWGGLPGGNDQPPIRAEEGLLKLHFNRRSH